MFHFNMQLNENFAIFENMETNEAPNEHAQIVIIDSFDNHTFNIRIGNISETMPLGSVQAQSNDELNELIRQRVTNFMDY
jgi:hypothetical protein